MDGIVVAVVIWKLIGSAIVSILWCAPGFLLSGFIIHKVRIKQESLNDTDLFWATFFLGAFICLLYYPITWHWYKEYVGWGVNLIDWMGYLNSKGY